jgi:two-component system, cell cycle sensor histidine kinase and response regulator CckA
VSRALRVLILEDKMSGPVLAESLRARHPGLRVLFMSGYTADAIGRHGVLEAGLALLHKPFTPDALARKVRELLDAPGPPPAG